MGEAAVIRRRGLYPTYRLIGTRVNCLLEICMMRATSGEERSVRGVVLEERRREGRRVE